jgi:hypothetical protein
LIEGGLDDPDNDLDPDEPREEDLRGELDGVA